MRDQSGLLLYQLAQAPVSINQVDDGLALFRTGNCLCYLDCFSFAKNSLLLKNQALGLQAASYEALRTCIHDRSFHLHRDPRLQSFRRDLQSRC